MTEEPYRWLEAVANRRDYVREQLKGGSPLFGASLDTGLVLVAVGSGQSKVFELFDRHALAGLGHPADIEKVRQSAIDAAHMEAFTRAPEDVSLRRLVSFGLSPQLKTNFEQIFSAPFLVELLLTELSNLPAQDLLVRLHFDGAFQIQHGGVSVVASQTEMEPAAREWLAREITTATPRQQAVEILLQAWWCLVHGKSFGPELPGEDERKSGWRADTKQRTVEIGWLDRKTERAVRYQPLSLKDLNL